MYLVDCDVFRAVSDILQSNMHSYRFFNRIGGLMVSVLASSAVDRGFEPGQVKPKTIKLVFVTFPLGTQH